MKTGSGSNSRKWSLDKDNLKKLLKDAVKESPKRFRTRTFNRNMSVDIAQAVETADVNDDGSIDFEEFLRLMTNLLRQVMLFHKCSRYRSKFLPHDCKESKFCAECFGRG